MELRFENETSDVKVGLPFTCSCVALSCLIGVCDLQASRLERRVRELEIINLALQEHIQDSSNTPASSRPSARSGTPVGSGGQSVAEMEKVVLALRKLVEKLQAKYDNLLKNGVPPSKHMAVVREARTLKEANTELQAKVDTLESKKAEIEELHQRIARWVVSSCSIKAFWVIRTRLT